MPNSAYTYDFSWYSLLVTFLNELIYWHLVKWFQVFLSNTNNSIYTQLNSFKYSPLLAQSTFLFFMDFAMKFMTFWNISNHHLIVFIIKGFRAIVFIVISTTFLSSSPLQVFVEPTWNFEVRPLLNPWGSPVLIPLAITGYKC